jgi:serine/threonine protein kinase
MELCASSARDVFDYEEVPLKEEEIALITYETLKGLEFMHQNNYIHRDIKAANILVTQEGEVKLSKFYYFFFEALSLSLTLSLNSF